VQSSKKGGEDGIHFVAGDDFPSTIRGSVRLWGGKKLPLREGKGKEEQKINHTRDQQTRCD